MQGLKGDKGEDADEEYGVATVLVQRGEEGGVVPWAVYSTELGSPVGDSTGGIFRFTCRTADELCKLSVQAKVLSDSDEADAFVFPRVLLYRGGSQSTVAEPEFYCEYADGPGTVIFRETLDSGPGGRDVTLNIGGSADCGADPTAGDVMVITVPQGYYDVQISFQFFKEDVDE